MTTKKRLCNIKGISEAKMEKIKEACLKICVSYFPLLNGTIVSKIMIFFILIFTLIQGPRATRCWRVTVCCCMGVIKGKKMFMQ